MKLLTFIGLIVLICEYTVMEKDLGDIELQNNIFKIWIWYQL